MLTLLMLSSCSHQEVKTHCENTPFHHIRYYSSFYSFDLIGDTLYVKDTYTGCSVVAESDTMKSSKPIRRKVYLTRANKCVIDSLVSTIKYAYVYSKDVSETYEDALVVDGETIYYSTEALAFKRNKICLPPSMKNIASTLELMDYIVCLGDSDLYRRWRNYPYYPDDN